MKFFNYFTEIIGFIQILASPLLIGLLIGTITAYNYQDKYGLAAGILIAFAGLITGLFFAIRIWKKYGTMKFLARISSSTEMNEEKEGE